MYTYLSTHVQIHTKFSERVKKKSFNKKYAVKFKGIIARNDFTSLSNFLLLIKTKLHYKRSLHRSRLIEDRYTAPYMNAKDFSFQQA